MKFVISNGLSFNFPNKSKGCYCLYFLYLLYLLYLLQK